MSGGYSTYDDYDDSEEYELDEEGDDDDSSSMLGSTTDLASMHGWASSVVSTWTDPSMPSTAAGGGLQLADARGMTAAAGQGQGTSHMPPPPPRPPMPTHQPAAMGASNGNGVNSAAGSPMPAAGQPLPVPAAGAAASDAAEAAEAAVECSAWLPGVLTRLLRRAAESYKTLRDALTETPDRLAAMGARLDASGRALDPAADAELCGLLDDLQDVYTRLVLANTRRTARLCALAGPPTASTSTPQQAGGTHASQGPMGQEGPIGPTGRRGGRVAAAAACQQQQPQSCVVLALWTLETLSKQAEQGIVLVQEHDK